MAVIGNAQGGTLDENFEVALGTAALSTKTARFDENFLRFFRKAEFTTPFYDACSENPWRIPFFTDNIRRELAGFAGKPSDSLNAGARLVAKPREILVDLDAAV